MEGIEIQTRKTLQMTNACKLKLSARAEALSSLLETVEEKAEDCTVDGHPVKHQVSSVQVKLVHE